MEAERQAHDRLFPKALASTTPEPEPEMEMDLDAFML